MTHSITMERRLWRWLRIVGVAWFSLAILLPVAYVVLVSLTPDTEVGDGSILPTHIAWNNYRLMWSTVHLAHDIGNSVVISGCTGFLATMVALLASYVLSRFRFRGRKPFLISLITMQTIPQVMMLLPLFVILVIIQNVLRVHLVGQYATIIVTYLTFALPFACWLLMSYMSSIPIELEEAAQVDGCTRFQTLTHVVLPLILPGMVVTFVFSFLLGWSDVLFASVLTTPSTQTVAVGLQSYVATGESGGTVFWGQLMAASLTSGIPVVIIFLFLQRFIIGGLAHGAVKG